MSKNTRNSHKSVIEYYINGLPRSEISAITGISSGAIFKYHQELERKSRRNSRYRGHYGFYETSIQNRCNDERMCPGVKEIQDAEILTIFWSFINDIYKPCLKLGIPPPFIPGWINDLLGFFSYPNRRDDIIYSPNSQNASNKQSNSIISIKSKPKLKPNPSSSQLTYPYNIEKPEMAKTSHAKREISQYECSW